MAKLIDPLTESPAEGGSAADETVDNDATEVPAGKGPVREIGGRNGPDPTRYGDWEKNGRCIDF